MSLLDDLIASLSEDAPIRSVLVGLHWVVVCSRFCGMASTLQSEHSHGTPDVREAGNLQSKSAKELVQLIHSDSALEASIGMAAINSLLEVDETQGVEINAADVLAERGQGKNVALIGHFPFISRLRGSVGQLWVIEKHPVEGDYPDYAALELLPRADVVAITGTTFINRTIDGLLELCSPAATVMVLGPSTPLSPILFDYGVDILSGTRVVDEAAALRTVGQGASFRQVEGVKLLTFVSEKKPH
ncbi:MAG: DUF364 domain-containing protein [Anaerolineales bacterium]|nr:DUF364 domain-containing protein [Anaerolineales bacterium]